MLLEMTLLLCYLNANIGLLLRSVQHSAKAQGKYPFIYYLNLAYLRFHFQGKICGLYEVKIRAL